MNGRLAANAAKNVDAMLKYAYGTMGEEEAKKIEASYKKGKVFSIVYVVVLIGIMIATIALLMHGEKGYIYTLGKDGMGTCYAKGSPANVDLTKVVENPIVGEKYFLTFDAKQNVTSAITYGEYQEKQKTKGMTFFFSFIGVMIGGFAGYVLLFRKIVAKDWYQFTKNYKIMKELP